MKKQMTLVYYYVPQDKDDPQVPNVFGISIKKDDIRLKHLYENFPISGQYIFRFKVLYENNIAWLDLPDHNAKLPTFKDKIMIKASRISWQTKKNPFEQRINSTQIQHQNKAMNEVTNQNIHNIDHMDHIFKSADSRQDKKPQKIIPKAQSSKKVSQSFNLIDEVHLHGNNTQSGHNDSLL